MEVTLEEIEKTMKEFPGDSVYAKHVGYLLELVRDMAWDSFSSGAHFDKEKQEFNSMALSHVNDAADILITLGYLEKVNQGAGRMQFYREVKKWEGEK